jgi:ATP-dependent RNA helicase RhlE
LQLSKIILDIFNFKKYVIRRFITFKSIQRAVYEQGYTNPTPIQEQSIPLVLAGKDLMHKKRQKQQQLYLILTSYCRFIKESQAIRALVVTPTRELAVKVLTLMHNNLTQLTILWCFTKPQVDPEKRC